MSRSNSLGTQTMSRSDSLSSGYTNDVAIPFAETGNEEDLDDDDVDEEEKEGNSESEGDEKAGEGGTSGAHINPVRRRAGLSLDGAPKSVLNQGGGED